MREAVARLRAAIVVCGQNERACAAGHNRHTDGAAWGRQRVQHEQAIAVLEDYMAGKLVRADGTCCCACPKEDA
jgi:hypothetical protein